MEIVELKCIDTKMKNKLDTRYEVAEEISELEDLSFKLSKNREKKDWRKMNRVSETNGTMSSILAYEW